MNNLHKIKEQSPLVKSVLALDHHFSELSRLSARIQEMEMRNESDLVQMQRLMNAFAECGQSVSTEVVGLSTALNEARMKAEEDARVVAARAEELQGVQTEREKKLEEFRVLGEKVQVLTSSLHDLKRPEGEQVSEEDRARIAKRLLEVEAQLKPLIEEAQALKKDAQSSKMKGLEQGAHSLSQSLLSVTEKLHTFQQADRSLQ